MLNAADKDSIQVDENGPVAPSPRQSDKLLNNNPLVINVRASLRAIPQFLAAPLRLVKSYELRHIQADFVAGLTTGVIALPQAIAFALIAELPPVMGLYATAVAGVVGALWGSTNQMNTGPANAISILVLSVLLTTATPGSPEFIAAAGLLALMAGVFQLVIGLSRLGVLVNFVSHSVIVGFASGAGVLIGANQLKHLLGLEFESRNLIETLQGTLLNLPFIHWPTAMLGIGTMLVIILMRMTIPKIPGSLVAMIGAAIVVFLFNLESLGVGVIGELPTGLPPIASLPIFDINLIAELSTGALAVGAIGLIQTTAIARAFSSQTGQRLDSNQEFVGQGLANITAGIFSGYAGAGSFARSAVNFKAGAQTRMSSLFASGVVILALLGLGPLGVYLPRAALAGVLILTAYGLIDQAEIKLIWQGNRSDAIIMLVTFLGTLFLQIEFAVLAGVLISFAFYITKTSVPRVFSVVPDEKFKHFVAKESHHAACPQLGIIKISGDLYFGAVSHVEEAITDHLRHHPEQRFLLLRMHGVNQCDMSGIHTLMTIRRKCQERGGDLYFMKMQLPVLSVMMSSGFYQQLGADHFLEEEQTIPYLFHRVLDPAVCIYECPVRVFKECQNLPKREYPGDELPAFQAIPPDSVPVVPPQDLWKTLKRTPDALAVIDVREPREFMQGHVPQAQLIPLAELITKQLDILPNKKVVLVCRSGRRSLRAAHVLQKRGYEQVSILQGGILNWEASGLLEAVDTILDPPAQLSTHGVNHTSS